MKPHRAIIAAKKVVIALDNNSMDLESAIDIIDTADLQNL